MQYSLAYTVSDLNHYNGLFRLPSAEIAPTAFIVVSSNARHKEHFLTEYHKMKQGLNIPNE